MTTKETTFDIAIVGGGPAGSAMAILMEKKGYKILVIERSDFTSMRIGESLDPSVQPLLQTLGVWERFLGDNHLPAYAIQTAWGDAELKSQSYLFNPYGNSWHIDRNRFDAMLMHAAKEAGATCLLNAHAIDFQRTESMNWQITYRYKKKIRQTRARFSIDATGRASSCSRRLGIHKVIHDKLAGIAMKYVLPASQSLNNMPTIVESTIDGWWYAAPLPDQSVIAVYMTDLDIAVQQMANTLEVWQSRLQETEYIFPLISTGRPIGRPTVFPAYSQRVSANLVDDVLPIGDAFMSLDPLSGQGMVHALRNAMKSADLVQQYFNGRTQVISEHLNKLDDEYFDYLKDRRNYYQRESRWADALFWQRRQA